MMFKTVTAVAAKAAMAKLVATLLMVTVAPVMVMGMVMDVSWLMRAGERLQRRVRL